MRCWNWGSGLGSEVSLKDFRKDIIIEVYNEAGQLALAYKVYRCWVSEFQAMPRVLATGFMVGLFEWACIQAINPHIDWPEEQTVGIHINLSHTAATPPGLTITVKGKLEEVEGRKLSFSLVADDGVDKISEGTHDRFVINAAKFNDKMSVKAGSKLGE